MTRRWKSKQKNKTKNMYLNAKFAQYFGLKDKRSLGAGPFFLAPEGLSFKPKYWTHFLKYISWRCTYNTLSNDTSLYRQFKGVPFPPEIRRRRIRETVRNVIPFVSDKSLHVVMSMSGLQGTPWDWHQVSCWAVRVPRLAILLAPCFTVP